MNFEAMDFNSKATSAILTCLMSSSDISSNMVCSDLIMWLNLLKNI